MSPAGSRPHLLMTADAVGGVWVFAATLARGLQARGYRVTIVTLGPPPGPAQRALLGEDDGPALIVTDLALEWRDTAGTDGDRTREVLSRVARRCQPDIVQANGYREVGCDWAAPVVLTGHSCVRSWWHACRGEEPPREWAAYCREVAAALAAADRWVAPTAAFRDTMRALYGPPVQSLAIWNGCSEQAGPAAKQPVVMAAGRIWDEAKNIAALAAVAPELPWPVRVAGPRALATDASGAAADDRVAWLGELSRQGLLAEMRRAEIFAAPALYEPFGLGVLEAGLQGCALVLADIPTLRELWDGAALFCEPRDHAALAAALQQLCADEAPRRQLQRAARQRARRYTAEAMCDGYADLYASLLGHAPHARAHAAPALQEVRA